MTFFNPQSIINSKLTHILTTSNQPFYPSEEEVHFKNSQELLSFLFEVEETKNSPINLIISMETGEVLYAQ